MPLFSLCPGYLVNNRAERCTLSASLPGQGPFPCMIKRNRTRQAEFPKGVTRFVARVAVS